MPTLRILLLGPPEVFLDDRPFRIERRLLRVMLYYLACQPAPLNRSELMLAFWPDASEGDARRRLRETLSKLRAALPDAGLLITDRQSVGLDHTRVFVDLREFQKVVEQTRHQVYQIADNTPLPQGLYEKLLDADRLWRSTRFLAGASLSDSSELDRWMVNTSQVLEYSRQHILERLAMHQAAIGDLETAIHLARIGLEIDELNTNLHYRILGWMLAMGSHFEAVRYAHHIFDLFLHQEGLDLPKTLKALCEKVLTEADLVTASERQAWPGLLSRQVPFVGRVQLLQDLRRWFFLGGVVSLQGESGSGKTRILQELYQGLDPTPRLFVAGARSMESELPFQVLADVLRQNVRQTEWETIGQTDAASLALFIPEMRTYKPGLPMPRAPVPLEVRGIIFESVLHLLEIISRRQRILFFLDDAQWCDEASLAAMGYLAERRFFDQHGLLVIASRHGESTPGLNRLLTQIGKPGTLKKQVITEMTIPEVGDLIRAVTGQTPSPEFIARMAADTGGNPLYILESLHSIMQSAVMSDVRSLTGPLPLSTSIRLLLRDRLRLLPDRARDVFYAAAIIGAHFSMGILEIVSGTSGEKLVQVMERLEQVNLVRPSPHNQTEQTYIFVHEKIREVIIEEMSLARRRLLHLKTARAMQDRLNGPAGSQAAVIARHFEYAGEVKEAFGYWLQAGQHALSLFSPPDAFTAFRRAEWLLQEVEQKLSDAEIYLLYSAWGEAASKIGDRDTMRHCFFTLFHSGEKRQNLLLLGSGLSGLAMTFDLQTHSGQAIETQRQAIAYLEKSEDLFELMNARHHLGWFLIWNNRLPEAYQEFESVVKLGSDSCDRRCLSVLAVSEYQLSLVKIQCGFMDEAAALAEKALINARIRYRDEAAEAHAHAALCISRFYQGDYRVALEHCFEGLRLAEVHQLWRTAGHLHIMAGRIYLLKGCVDDAWKHAGHALQAGLDFSMPEVVSEARCVRGDIFREMRDYPQAIDEFLQGCQSPEGSYQHLDNLYRLAFCQVLNGQVDVGMAGLEQAITQSRSRDLGLVLLPAEYSRAVLGMSVDKPASDDAPLEHLAAEAASRGMNYIPTLVRLYFCQRSFLQGDLETAGREAAGLLEDPMVAANPWLHIGCLQVNQDVLLARKEDASDANRRIHEIIEKLSAYVTLPELRPSMLVFTKNLLTVKS